MSLDGVSGEREKEGGTSQNVREGDCENIPSPDAFASLDREHQGVCKNVWVGVIAFHYTGVRGGDVCIYVTVRTPNVTVPVQFLELIEILSSSFGAILLRNLPKCTGSGWLDSSNSGLIKKRSRVTRSKSLVT